MKEKMNIAEGVYFTNDTFGNNPITVASVGIDAYWEKLAKQYNLIVEEFGETVNKGIKARNIKEARDGVCDVLVTAYGLDHIGSLNIDLQEALILDEDDASFALDRAGHYLVLVGANIKERNHAMLTQSLRFLLQNIHSLGLMMYFDVKGDMQAVLDSNLSKVSKTQGDAIITQTYYRETVGINTRIEVCPTMPGFIVKVAGTQTGKDGKVYTDGKFLKCRVSFHEPKFDPLPTKFPPFNAFKD